MRCRFDRLFVVTVRPGGHNRAVSLRIRGSCVPQARTTRWRMLTSVALMSLTMSFLTLIPAVSSAQDQQPPNEPIPNEVNQAEQATEQVTEQSAEELPLLEDLETPSAEELLTESPKDWILLNTEDVLIVESLSPRPGTLELRQEEIDNKEAQRRGTVGSERDRIQEELNELRSLAVVLPDIGDNREFRLPIRRIRKIIHHEDHMLRRATLLLQERRIPQALELLTRLQLNWEDWPAHEGLHPGLTRSHDDLVFVDARVRLDHGDPESALMLLDELYGRNKTYQSNLGDLAEVTGEAVRRLTEEALATDDFIRAQFFLNRLLQRFPGHPVYQGFDAALQTRVGETLQQAARAAGEGDHRGAAIAAEQAARIWPKASGLRGPHRTYSNRYQRLHVGVVDQPGTSNAYWSPTAADQRLQALTEQSLFEIDRIRDGTAYYRTRFFDEWEPFDLGREMRFTLKEFRQPFEMQAVLTASDVVAPILSRLDPEGLDYDERLDAFVRSVTVESPTQFTLSFRRVPPRLEPLLARIRVTNSPDLEPYALSPLSDPGGFQLTEADGDQLVFTRKLTEPEGLPQFHVAEIVEHRYETHEKAVQGLVRGEVSALPELPDWILRRMLNDDEFLKRYFIQPYMIPETHVLQFNPGSTPLQIRELRTALSYAIDRDRLLREVILRDSNTLHGRVVTTPFLSASPGRNVLIRPRRYDLSAAFAMSLAARKKLESEIPPLTMILAPGVEAEAAGQEIAERWRRIGLQVNVVLAHEPRPRTWDVLYRTTRMPEPLVEMWPFLAVSDRAVLNELNHYPDWLKQELVELDRTSDQSRAITALQQLHRHLWIDSAIVPLWEIDRYIVFRKNVQGFRNTPIHCYTQVDRWIVDAWYQTELP